MQHSNRQTPARYRHLCFYPALLLWLIPACESTMPSARFQNEIKLPIPALAMEVATADRFSRDNHGEAYTLTPRSLISIAFNGRPDIKSSFHRFKSEEARYDFFYTSRDSMTPRIRTSNSFGETRGDELVTRDRDHTLELGVEKRFFDTTELNAAVGFQTDAVDEAIGSHPFVSANLRYPLWASRKRLERTSEEIFRRNELDDAQLAYIQQVRWRLQETMWKFYEVVQLRQRVEHLIRWQRNLEALLKKLEEMPPERDGTPDRERIEAEIAKVAAEVRNTSGRYDIDFERLKGACGLPFHATVEVVDEPFNPFEGVTHEELFRLSIETDPEIATLRNSERNAEVQLDLARRGRWDIALLLDGTSDLEGMGEHEGASDWSASVGLEVSAVDARVTDSLIRQAEANIVRFSQAIAARENDVFVDTYEPLIRIETLGTSRDELVTNLPRYQSDYGNGVAEYVAGNLNIDDLLKRRENLFDQEEQISYLTFMVGANVAELCAATGKFFELLDLDHAD
ncbi:MAG: TolC family protein [Phycisphaerae bacterium]